MGALFNTLLITPSVNILLLFYFIFAYASIPGALGFSIATLTVFFRVITQPFYVQQITLSRKMEHAKPQLDELAKIHKHDKKALQEEQLKVYKELGINPASGCLTTIVQIPLIYALYATIQLLLTKGPISKVAERVNDRLFFDFLKVKTIDPLFFGFNLAVAPSHFREVGWYYLLIPLLTGVLQYVQATVTMPMPKKNIGEEKKDDMSAAMATQMRYMLPVMIGFFSYSLPVGLSIYWNVFSLTSIIQHRGIKPFLPENTDLAVTAKKHGKNDTK